MYRNYWDNRNRADLNNNLQQQAREATINMAKALNVPSTAINNPTSTTGTTSTNGSNVFPVLISINGLTSTTSSISTTTTISPNPTIANDFKFGLKRFYQDLNDLFDIV
ncbi:hypothetical protein INT46_006771 [Mucor plumbeus]|uniref:Uncharacterized protein n=1 Tax=Mucor plumbeus TaxID=97098 RepID=A0A8H7V9Y0_9FUNG|nr:hypothetical protein INT46_006771 [Mucor plumbeus]